MSSLPETRSPLENTTNESQSPNPSPPHATAKKGPLLRRKPSNRALHPRLDSSESYPSPHSSIYEASFVSSSAEQLNWYDTSDGAAISTAEPNPSSWATNEPASWENTVMDSSGNVVPASFLQETPSPRKHTPHKLYPITEQNSLATLRPLNGHPSAASIRPISPGLNGKKQKSFSTSDIPPIPQASTPSPPPSPREFYTPIEPQRPPPIRMSTPPSLPKFNTPAATTYRLPPPTVRFRDKFRSPTPAERQWSMQTIGLPRGVVMRGEDGVLVRGKFTPIRSGHFPPQRQQHPVYRVGDGGGIALNLATREVAPARPVVVDGHVRFTGPRIEGVGDAAAAGGVGDVEGQKKVGKGERAERALGRFYWVVGCCGVCERWGARVQVGSGTQGGLDGTFGGGDRPLFAGGFDARER